MQAAKFIPAENLANEIAIVVGTRPGIIMLAPVINEIQRCGLPYFVIHTGQHYSPSMDSELFEDLGLADADHHLAGVAEHTTHGGQTAAMIVGCEEVMLERKPRLVLVNGDANTNFAAAVAARKLRLGLGHIEAGERSFDWRMPEEHNRRMIDHISDLLFATGEEGRRNLEREGVQGQVFVTGNTIVDASMFGADRAKDRLSALERYGVEPGGYALLTSHREENVDVPEKLKAIVKGASRAAMELGMPVIFLAHPRTMKRLEQFDLLELAQKAPGLILDNALRYLDFMSLIVNARIVLTDSGGVQQEAHIHGKPCVTLRDTTEWRDTLQMGANRLAGSDDDRRIAAAAVDADGIERAQWPQVFGDGTASRKIVDIASEFAGLSKQAPKQASAGPG